MIGAAISDLHLGFRAYAAVADGRNAREQDVERAWAAAVDRIVYAAPDLVTIAGDVFHHPRVGMHAVKAYRDGLRRIVDEADAEIVVIQGNHDAGRTAEVLSPIVVPDDYRGVHVVLEPKRLLVRTRAGERVAVTCLPFVARGAAAVYELEPDPGVVVNVLLMHAAARTTAAGADQLPAFYAGEEALDVGREAERWDVIAVGDYHEFRRLHPTALAFYSGSIERTSSNIWPEKDPKGVVIYGTGTGQLDFQEIPTREVVDLHWQPALDALPTAAALNAILDHLVEQRTGADAIMRMAVRDFPRSERDAVDWRLVRALKHNAFHFQLDLHFAAGASADGVDRRDRAVRSLADEAAEFFAAETDAVRGCALAYLGGEA